MNFNYSYKAFLISSLLVGNLILILVTVKLQKREMPNEDTVPIEYTELIPENEDLALSNASEKVKIETNTAYNEAEQFIREIENSRNETYEETVPEESNPSHFDFDGNNTDFNKAQRKLEEVKKKLASTSANKIASDPKTVNKKTTISYRLVNRKALQLPNPVYTCEGDGKIVITIEVNALGKVTKTTYNPTLSTTSNVCLIEAAIDYAKKSRFTTDGAKPEQLGTITYLFPGQN